MQHFKLNTYPLRKLGPEEKHKQKAILYALNGKKSRSISCVLEAGQCCLDRGDFLNEHAYYPVVTYEACLVSLCGES